ncbi:hypothetical protein ACT4R9_02530 [Ornithobacterium rhinotracheale]|uniref:hypothetical protein n=1 Tax=Ornithobacterium rhinotracheale TaxID=28251 RepID=UPI003FA4CCC3
MKKKMYKLGALALLAVSMSVTAQEKPTGRVGINIPDPKATLDISVSEANKDATTNEGIMAPQLSKERVAKIAAPVEGTLVYVVDDADKGGLISDYKGRDAKVEKIDTKGYYYFDGTEWVKSAGKGGGANDDIWQKQSNGDVKLVDADIESEILYTPYGGHFNYPTSFRAYAYNNGDEISNIDRIGLENANASLVNYGYANKIANGVYVKEGKYPTKNFIKNTLIVDGQDNNSSLSRIVMNYNELRAVNSSTKKYESLYAGTNVSTYSGMGTVEYLLGNVNTTSLNSGISNFMVGSYNQATTGANFNTHIGYFVGTHSLLTPSGSGSINQAFGTLNRFRILNEEREQSVNLKTLVLTRNEVEIKKGLFTGTIDKIYGTSTFFDVPEGTNVKEMYGIAITDVIRGTEKNYAIYTNAGKVRFGDSVGIGVDAPEEKLEVAGNVKAESFLGANGAGIFPDYVFEDYYQGNSSIKADYKFKSLSQVEDYVKQNGHLPGYASAKQIQKQGYVDLMATQLTNVEKIEELYLHSIEQDKALKAKDAKIQELEARLAKLEALLSK